MKSINKSQLHFYSLAINNQNLKVKIHITIYNSFQKYEILNNKSDFKMCILYLYTENYATVLRKTKENLNKWRRTSCLWVRRQYCLDIIHLKLIYRFNTILGKLSGGFFVEIDKLISKSVWKCKRPRTAKTALKKESKVGKAT